MFLLRRVVVTALILGLSFIPGIGGSEAMAALPDSLEFVDISEVDPTIPLDIKYATADNFTGQVLYPAARCLLRADVAERLQRAQKDLRSQGYGLKVFDCYRPLSVQKKMWAIMPDPRYVADPASGSRHNRGASVDVGLVDSFGREMPMPSSYDEFSERSHADYAGGSAESRRYRSILRQAMTRAGFLTVDTEWWHFDDPNWRDYPISDVSLKAPLTGVSQLLWVPFPGNGVSQSVLRLFEKHSGFWREVGDPIPVTIGRNGFAGEGLKREGDGMTPSGLYHLGTVFGYAARLSTLMPYRQAGERDVWVDEPASPDYNQWVSMIPVRGSYELMRRGDDLYKIGIVINYNMAPIIPGKGSAIFIHIWREPGVSTAGCVAMAESQILRLVQWLDPGKNPMIRLGSRG